MKRLLILLFLVAASSIEMAAQQYSNSEFKVLSFRRLSWDLDARVNHPVIDQNGKKAALLKVITNETDFSFDVGIMGVTEVRQEDGEIWVYVPEYVRKITIKHKNFGVIRDFIFTEPIESAVTYELMLKTPEVPPVPEKEIIIRDSIVYVPTVADSAIVLTRPRRQPIGIGVSVIYSFPKSAFGAMIDFERFNWGGYVKATTNLKGSISSYNCHSDGTIDGGYIWTSGNVKRSQLTITAGPEYRILEWLRVYAGLGYGKRILLWEDMSGRWAKVTDFSYQGVCADAGTQFGLSRWRLTAGVSTISFKTLSCELGVGFCF